MIHFSSRLFFWLYVATLLLVGSGGVLFARQELASIYHLDLQQNLIFVTEAAQANFLNQYRFLKASELGIGIFCVVFWRDIFCTGRLHTVFLSIVAVGVFARVWSLLHDGMPQTMFIGFLLFELATGLLVFITARKNNSGN